VIGWTKSSTRARPFGSLLLAKKDGDAFVYKGKVGTGFNVETGAYLAARFARIARKTPPVCTSLCHTTDHTTRAHRLGCIGYIVQIAIFLEVVAAEHEFQWPG